MSEYAFNPLTGNLDRVGTGGSGGGTVDSASGANGIDVTPTTGDVIVSGINATTSQIGVILLADNAESIAGTDTSKAITPDDLKAKLGLQTVNGLAYGNDTSSEIQWLGEALNGQIPIGDTGGIPVLGNITSTDGSVGISNGPGTIDLITNRTAFSVFLNTNQTNFGGGGGDLVVPFDTKILDTDNSWNTSTYGYTCPKNGFMMIGGSIGWQDLNSSTGNNCDLHIANDAGFVYELSAWNPFLTQRIFGGADFSQQGGSRVIAVNAGNVLKFLFVMGAGGVSTVTMMGGIRYTNAWGVYL